ncbi:MAG: FAD-binding protein [Planctomycetaceae bacterium]|nr:FAD-binding protein [Planctomycetaceae bacterium]
MPIDDSCETLVRTWAEWLKDAPAEQCFFVRGGGTKLALLPWEVSEDRDLPIELRRPQKDAARPPREICTEKLTGIIEYRPAEFTITVYAGTPVSEVMAVLNAHGQYLPFESPFHVATYDEFDKAQSGRQTNDLGNSSSRRTQSANRTTVGGMVAAGINGPGRLKHGGLRDFILEVRYIDGSGEIRRGGRRVVKNAAGFDIPKLMVGSCGRFGVIVDATFKVFPKPRDYLTLHFIPEQLGGTIEIVTTLLTHPWDLDAIEILADSSVLVRLSGHSEALLKHGQRIQSRLSKYYCSFLTGAQQHQAWSAHSDWIWGEPNSTLLKVPLSLRRIFELDEALEELDIRRVYGSAGNVAWLQWETVLEQQAGRLKRLHRQLLELRLQGQIVQGPCAHHFSGASNGRPFFDRLKSVFDPHGRLGFV